MRNGSKANSCNAKRCQAEGGMDEEERRVWKRGMWEMVKEAVTQKILTWHLPSPPLLLPGQLAGLTVVVTGATSGIGLHTARELVMAGAEVIMACRNVQAANGIAEEWRAEAHENMSVKVEIMALDLLSLSSVRKFAEEWEKCQKPLHILINNAGALYMQEPQRFSEDGIERHMQINHIAPSLLTLVLLPSLVRPSSSRIVNVNSVGHNFSVINPSHWRTKISADKFNDMRAYGESKLAQLMFLKTLAAELLEKKITSIKCIAVNPGVVNTKLVKQRPIPDWKLFWMLNPVEGSRSVIFCATNAGVSENLSEGFAYYSFSCKPGKVSPQALDKQSCGIVWHKTLEILELKEDYLHNQIRF